MEKTPATNKILWIFAIGQLGWATLAGIINNWLVYFYQPSAETLGQGHHLFITQGFVLFGMLTVIGIITALGRVFDAFTDPWVGSLSDRCKNKLGRRIPFLRYAAIPFGIITALIFWAPVQGESAINNIWVAVTVLGFYMAMTFYCTPYNALIPELGRDQKSRVNVSTFISFTYFFGTAVAYAVPVIAGMLEGAVGYTMAYRIAITALCVIAIVLMLVPAFAIDENKYAVTEPSALPMGQSLKKTFSNKQFRIFVASDVLYWIALTMFQTGLSFYITVLMGLDESMITILFVLMSVISVVFYAPVNILAKRMGKKKMVLFAFIFFAAVFGLTSVVGKFGVPGIAWGVLVSFLAAIPMAVLGILPQAVVADIAQADCIETGDARQGMFYAARTFAFKLGQAVSMLVFSSIALVGSNGFGYRLTAIVACVFCLAAGLVFSRYNEKAVFATIAAADASEKAE